MKTTRPFPTLFPLSSFLFLIAPAFAWAGAGAVTPPTIQWQCGQPQADGFTVTKQTSDGGYMLGRTIFDSRDNADFNILRLGPTGNVLWAYTGGSFEVRYDDYLADITQVSDGGFAALIESASGLTSLDPNKTDGSFGNDDCWLIRLDADGHRLWDHTFGASGADQPLQLEQTAENGLAFAARFTAGTGGNRTSTNYGGLDVWFVRLDSTGHKLVEQSFGGSGTDAATRFLRTADGGFILVGNSDSPVSGNKTSPHYGNGDIWVIRLDANCTKLWDRSFGGTDLEWATDISERNCYFIVAGHSLSGISGNKTNAATGGWLFGLDEHGNKLWELALPENVCLNEVSLPPGLQVRWQRPTDILAAGFHLTLCGDVGARYVIESSPDLIGWFPLMTNTVASNPMEMVDPSVTSSNRAFYRARSLP